MKIALLFPGYGNHLVGATKDLYDNNRIIQEYFEEASSCLNINVVKLCFASSESELSKMENAQIALFLLSSSIYKVLEAQGIVPELVMGHNTGSYAALFAAKSISFPDGLYLLSKYAAFFQEFVASTAIKIIQVKGIERQQLEEWCAQASGDQYQAYVTTYYTDEFHCVGGHSPAVDDVMRLVGPRGEVEELNNAYGLHAPIADSLVDLYMPYLEKVDLKAPVLSFVSETEGRLISSEQDVGNEILSIVNKPLRFYHLMDVLALHELVIEVGAGTFLSTLIKMKYPEKHVITVHKQADIAEINTLLSPIL